MLASLKSRVKITRSKFFFSPRYIENRYAIVAKNSHRFITIRTHQRKPTYPPTHLFSNAFIALPPPPLPRQGPRYKTIDRAERRKCVCIYISGRETSLPINIPKSGLTNVPHRATTAHGTGRNSVRRNGRPYRRRRFRGKKEREKERGFQPGHAV